MTNEEWKIVKDKLSYPFGHAELKIDGYDVKIFVQQEKELKYCYAIYVNDHIKIEWCVNDCEERRRFMNPQKRSLLSNRQKAELKKKRMKREEKESILSQFEYYVYSPYFSSFSRLKSQLIKNNNSIELLEADV